MKETEVVYRDNYQFQNRKEKQQLTETTRRYHKVPSLNTNQRQAVSSTATKYVCTECNATLDTPVGHREHYQAFHERIEEPNRTSRDLKLNRIEFLHAKSQRFLLALR